ncbi:MAG: patatin-like phospholipase family protein [Planctomycetota bacterium]
MRRTPFALSAFLLVAATGCGLPTRNDGDAFIFERPGVLPVLEGFEEVRAVNGFPNEDFQRSFDEAIEKLKQREFPEGQRRDFDMLVLSSGGVNGSFGAGVLQGWTCYKERPEFEIVTGVSVGALLSPFAFAGPKYDDRLETLFRRLNPEDLHESKGALSAAIWDESLLDNSPLRALIRSGVDAELMNDVADGHEAGRRLYVGSTNLDLGCFVVWDMGAIATRRSPEALELFRSVLTASASIPVAYPPVRFGNDKDDERDELHVDGAVIRPLFLPEGIFDGYASAQKAGVSWDDIDASLYVISNGALRSLPAAVSRDTFDIAMRTIMMMSYTLISEDVLHLYLLSRVWGAEFNFIRMRDGTEVSVADFDAEETERLFLEGRGLMEAESPWDSEPPGYVVGGSLARIQPLKEEEVFDERAGESGAAAAVDGAALEARLDRMEAMLQRILSERGGDPGPR